MVARSAPYGWLPGPIRSGQVQDGSARAGFACILEVAPAVRGVDVRQLDGLMAAQAARVREQAVESCMAAPATRRTGRERA